jgi:uncharacterized membrane protein YbhN (UPF0104 family)
MSTRASSDRAYLGVSIVWSYIFAILLMVFIFTILVPDADGPSPWDGQAFRSGILEMAANFRILDELADLGIVKVADVGDGWLNVDLDLIGVSDRRFGGSAFVLAVVLGLAALMLRGIRQRFLARHFHGRPSPGPITGYFFGRGLNLFFPFGPGELGAAQSLTDGGVSDETAAATVFHNRLFELLAILLVLIAGLVYLGWAGAVLPFCLAIVLVAAVVSLTRPLGGDDTVRRNPFIRIWHAFNGPDAMAALRALLATPGLLVGLTLLSLVALGVETLAYWCIKQAFSSPLDDYVLMKDLPFVHFAIVIAVAATTRILPFTFASVGIYEIVTVAMFRVFDEGYLAGTTVALLDALLINTLTALTFAVVLWLGRCPSAFETWRTFVHGSRAMAEAETL